MVIDGSCSKFDVCGEVQQGDTIDFILTDNLRRDNVPVGIRAYFGKHFEANQLRMMKSNPYSYEFSFDANEQKVDVAILEILVDGEQIDISPVRLDVIERDCVLSTGDPRKVADLIGNCVCDWSSFVVEKSACIPIGMGFLIAAAPFFVLFAVVFHYVLSKRREAKFWIIEKDELTSLAFLAMARSVSSLELRIVAQKSLQSTPCHKAKSQAIAFS